MTLLLRLFQKCEILLRGHLAQTSPLKTIFLFVVSFFFWQLLNKITSNKTGNLKTFVISRPKRKRYLCTKSLGKIIIYPTGPELLTGKLRLYVPRHCGWVATHKFGACSVALWKVWGVCPPLFCLCCSGFLLCKEFHPFVSIKKRTVFGFFFKKILVNNPPVLVI